MSGHEGVRIVTAPPPIDPECELALSQVGFDFATVLGDLSDDTVAAIRERFAAAPHSSGDGAVGWTDHPVSDHRVSEESTTAKVRVYRPIGHDQELPCLYWMHGGGLVMGSYVDDTSRFEWWCVAHHCIGVSVEYRLAPEHRYPAPLDDCLTGLRWIDEHCVELGIDRNRIGIGGASAGAGLAAGVALRARDLEPDLTPTFQLLLYPMLDDRQTTRSSRWDDRIWPPSANRYGWSSYLGAEVKGRADVPVYAAPARAEDLTGLPPTLIVVGSADPFVDEDVEFARRLRVAGVEIDLLVYDGAFHGFDVAAGESDLATRARRDIDIWLSIHL